MDILPPVASLMIRSQAVNLPPWKVAIWVPKILSHLRAMTENLEKKIKVEEELSETLFPR